VLIPARDAVFDIIPALSMIEKMAKMPKAAAAIDLGQTESLIEQEREY